MSEREIKPGTVPEGRWQVSGEIQTTCWECPKCGVTLTSKTAKDHVCMSEHGSASTLIEPTTGERKPVNTDMGKNTGPGQP